MEVKVEAEDSKCIVNRFNGGGGGGSNDDVEIK